MFEKPKEEPKVVVPPPPQTVPLIEADKTIQQLVKGVLRNGSDLITVRTVLRGDFKFTTDTATELLTSILSAKNHSLEVRSYSFSNALLYLREDYPLLEINVVKIVSSHPISVLHMVHHNVSQDPDEAYKLMHELSDEEHLESVSSVLKLVNTQTELDRVWPVISRIVSKTQNQMIYERISSDLKLVPLAADILARLPLSNLCQWIQSGGSTSYVLCIDKSGSNVLGSDPTKSWKAGDNTVNLVYLCEYLMSIPNATIYVCP